LTQGDTARILLTFQGPRPLHEPVLSQQVLQQVLRQVQPQVRPQEQPQGQPQAPEQPQPRQMQPQGL
jgi:translation initiation factor IF-3